MPFPLSNSTPATILLKGDLEKYAEEKYAAGTITPGMLMNVNSADKFAFHASAGSVLLTEKFFAKENALLGLTIADNYVADDLVFGHNAQRGDEIYGLIANAVNVDNGSPLTSNGDGTLKVATGSDGVIAYSLEDKTASGATRCKIRVA